MNSEEIKKLIEDAKSYDDSKEDTLRSMISDFYNRKMLSFIILIWTYFIVIFALTIFSAVKFFKAQEIKDLIMFATIFVCCIIFMSIIKVFAWQMIHRNNIKRQIKRLEIRLAEVCETLQKQ